MTQLPGIYVPVSADYSALDKGLREAKTLAASRAVDISNAINNALSPNKISGGFDSLVRQLSSLDRASKVAQQGFSGIKTGLEDVRKVTSLTEQEWAKLQERFLSTQVANSQEAALKRIASQLKLNKEEVKAWGAQFGLVPEQVERVNKAVGNVTEGGKKKMEAFSGSIAIAAGKFLLLKQAAYSISRTLNSTVFDFNATIETATLGISAAFLNNGQYVDNITGKVLTGQAAMKAAMADAGSVINQLRASNLQTIATLDQLIRAYQEAAPVALKKGFNKEQVEQFTVAMMQAAGAVDTTGMLIGQMGEEMRSLLNGGINPRNTRIATALGITNEDVAKYKGDVQGLFNFIMSKLSAYQMFGEQLQSTWRGVASNTIDVLKQVSAKATEPVFTAVRDGLKGVTDSIGKVEEKTDELGNKTKAITWNPEYQRGVDDLRGSFEHLVDAVTGGRTATGEFFPALLSGSASVINATATLVDGIEDIYTAGDKLLGLNTGEWGVIGYALLKGSPQTRAIVTGMTAINSLISEMGSNVSSLPSGALEWGLAGYAMFGAYGPARIIAALTVTASKIQEVALSQKSAQDALANKDYSSFFGVLGPDAYNDFMGNTDAVDQQIETLKSKQADAQDAFNKILANSAGGASDLQKQRMAELQAQVDGYSQQINKLLNVNEKAVEAVGNIEKTRQLMMSQAGATWQATGNAGPSEEEIEGHKKLVEMLRTEREEIVATYEERKKFADTPELQQKLDAWKEQKLALIDEKEARTENTEAMRGERAELKQLSASVKSYVNDARDLARVSQEWNRDALQNIGSMQRLNDELLMSSMDENGQAMYEMARRFEEASPIFDDFQGNVERAKSSIEGLEQAYQSIGEQLEASKAALGSNSAGSDTEDLNKVHELAVLHQKIGETLEERKTILEQLNALEGQGVTSLDQFMTKWKESDRFDALVDSYRQLGYVTAETYDLMMAKADTWKENFINRTGEVELAQRLFDEKMSELSLDLEGSGWTEGIKNGLGEVAKEAQSTARSVSGALKDGFNDAADALAEFVVTGKLELDDLVNSALKSFAKIAIQQSITSPLASGFGGLLKDIWPFEGGGIMTSSGPVPLRKYSGGGIANSPQLAMFGEGSVPEAYVPVPNGKIPVQISGGSGGGNVVVNIIESSSKAGTVEQSQQNGTNIIDVFVSQVKSAVANDVIQGGGVVAAAFESTYRLNRAGM